MLNLFRHSLLIALAVALPAYQAVAATLVEIDHRKGLSRIYSDGGKGRMEMPGSDRYLLIDLDRKTLYFVKPAKHSVLDLSHFAGTIGPGGSMQHASNGLTRKGSGPTVAGYETTQFDYITDQTFCGSGFVSQKALHDSGLKTLLGVLGRIAVQADSLANLFKSKTDACQGADGFIAATVAQIGMPMRILDKDGQRWSEVTRIVKNAELPANAFSYPDTYQVNSPVQIRERIERKLKQHLPQINQLLKQLQKPDASAP